METMGKKDHTPTNLELFFLDKKELEEERRLFYVALTRAEERVYLLYATNRRRMGVEVANGLQSRFITTTNQ